jgi:hypothetical protein
VKQLLQELRVQEAADLLAEALKDDREGKAAVAFSLFPVFSSMDRALLTEYEDPNHVASWHGSKRNCRHFGRRRA